MHHYDERDAAIGREDKTRASATGDRRNAHLSHEATSVRCVRPRNRRPARGGIRRHQRLHARSPVWCARSTRNPVRHSQRVRYRRMGRHGRVLDTTHPNRRVGGYLCREIQYPGGQVDRDIVKEIAPEATEERRFEKAAVPCPLGIAPGARRHSQISRVILPGTIVGCRNKDLSFAYTLDRSFSKLEVPSLVSSSTARSKSTPPSSGRAIHICVQNRTNSADTAQ